MKSVLLTATLLMTSPVYAGLFGTNAIDPLCGAKINNTKEIDSENITLGRAEVNEALGEPDVFNIEYNYTSVYEKTDTHETRPAKYPSANNRNKYDVHYYKTFSEAKTYCAPRSRPNLSQQAIDQINISLDKYVKWKFATKKGVSAASINCEVLTSNNLLTTRWVYDVPYVDNYGYLRDEYVCQKIGYNYKDFKATFRCGLVSEKSTQELKSDYCAKSLACIMSIPDVEKQDIIRKSLNGLCE